jgi:hypothetical protein
VCVFDANGRGNKDNDDLRVITAVISCTVNALVTDLWSINCENTYSFVATQERALFVCK